MQNLSNEEMISILKFGLDKLLNNEKQIDIPSYIEQIICSIFEDKPSENSSLSLKPSELDLSVIADDENSIYVYEGMDYKADEIALRKLREDQKAYMVVNF